MTRRPLISVLAFGLALAAPRLVAAQERLILPTFSDEALHRLGAQVHAEPAAYELDLAGGLDAAMARGAVPEVARPFSAFGSLGFGIARGPVDLLQLRTQLTVPLPIVIPGGTGPMSAWDLDGAHRLRARLGLGGLESSGGAEQLRTKSFGLDLELEGALWQGGRFGTTYLRRDIGAHAFRDWNAKATVAPRLAVEREIALVLPATYELRRADVDTGASFQSQRVHSGFGVRPSGPKFAHGWFEIVGVGWEKTFFQPALRAPRPALSGVEHLDLRAFHADGVLFSPEKDIQVELDFGLGGDWLWDAASDKRLSTFSAKAGGALRGYPDHHKRDDGEDNMLAMGVSAAADGGFLADGSTLTKRGRFEGFFEGVFAGGRTGGSLRGAAEKLTAVGGDKDKDLGWRGAVSTEWFFGPVRPLQVGVAHASTQNCIGAATDGKAWCHRLGLFVRLSDAWQKPRAEPMPPTPPPPPPPPPPRLQVAGDE
jgi:hypothetical protein